LLAIEPRRAGCIFDFGGKFGLRDALKCRRTLSPLRNQSEPLKGGFGHEPLAGGVGEVLLKVSAVLLERIADVHWEDEDDMLVLGGVLEAEARTVVVRLGIGRLGGALGHGE